MKNIILLLLTAFSIHTQADLTKPAEFQYFHCVADKLADRRVTTHYVFEIGQDERIALHTDKAVKSAKAKDLRRLRKIDPDIQQVMDLSYDVVWVSRPARLGFKLNISDNGGQVLRGIVTSGRQGTEITCVDVALENSN